MRLPRFIDLWKRRPGKKPTRAVRSKPATEPAAHDDAEAESFRRALLQVLNSQPVSVAGKINFVNLDPLKDRLGERWDRARVRVDQLVCKIIEAHLAPNDLFSRYDELNYLVIFASLDEDMAAFKCAKISEQILGALLGVDGMAMAGVRSLAAGVDGKIVTVDKSLGDCVDALAQSAETRAVADGRVTTLHGGGGSTGAAPPGADTPDGLRAAAEAQAEDQPLSFSYSPFWNVGQQAVTAFRCSADPSGTDTTAWTSGFPEAISLFSAIDLQTLRHGAEALEADISAGTKYLCVLPVGIGTLSHQKSRSLYVEALKGLSAAARRCLALEITGIPADAASSRLEEVTGFVKPLIRELLWLLDIKCLHLAKRTPPGVTGVGMNIGSGGPGETELLKVMNNFAIAAERRSLASYLVGGPTRSLILAAAAAGFTYVDGSGTLGSKASPEKMFSYKWEHLYGDLSAPSVMVSKSVAPRATDLES